MPVSIELQQADDHWTLSLSGDLDYAECAQLRLHIDRILRASPPAVIADLSGLEYMDSSGLGLLLSLSREYATQSGRLVLVTNKTVDDILLMTRLTGIFTIAESVEQAIELLADTRSIGREPPEKPAGSPDEAGQPS